MVEGMKRRHRLIKLPEIADQRGHLAFAQEGDQIPFSVRRIFIIYSIPQGIPRGGHAHRGQHQLLMMMSGNGKVRVDDGTATTELELDRPSCALHVPPMLWLDLVDFSENAVCAVLASGAYDETDYIRDYGKFKKLAAAQG